MCGQVKWNTDNTDVDNDVSLKQGVNSCEHEDIKHVALQPRRDSVVDEETVPARHHCFCNRSSSSTCSTAGDQRNIILSTTACQVNCPVH